LNKFHYSLVVELASLTRHDNASRSSQVLLQGLTLLATAQPNNVV
jgi:hypothetical protein